MEGEASIAARVLATYLIPGCVGRGVRLGSESSSAGAAVGGGVWKSGNLGILKYRNLESDIIGDHLFRINVRHAQNVGRVLMSRKRM